ncbi:MULTISPECIES: glutamate ABC transporter substrate-binding protein [unclassified Kitasatospora]|uniref:glutamate ABC transporter substrate-binding protein n=1 Tax=unclassified Kitasatospora TaxID=2633591 RepID=UPI002474E7C1|nr:glutamate ABC transporter substrate-binding protein [Kitasatospora sp. MAP12-44]
MALPATSSPAAEAGRPSGAVRVAALQAPAAPASDTCDPQASLTPSALPAPGAPMPAGSTMAKIQSRGRLIAAVDQTSYLWGYRDPGTGTLEGFDVDLVHAIAKALFGDPDKVEFRAVSSAQRLTAVASGEVDIAADSITMTCAREQQVAFSTDYYNDGQRLLVRTDSGAHDLADLAGRKVCAASGTTSIATLGQAVPAVVPVGVTDWTDCLVLLQLGQVDGISTDEHILQGLQAQDPQTEVVGPAFTFEPHGLAIAKQNSDFVRFTNAVLEQLRTGGGWQQLYTHWMGRFGQAAQQPAPHYLP